MDNKKTDNVNMPSHYMHHPSGVSNRDVAKALNANLSNAFKYLYRHAHKDEPARDIKKCLRYLSFEYRDLVAAKGAEHWFFQPNLRTQTVRAIQKLIQHEENTFVKSFYQRLELLINADTNLDQLSITKSLTVPILSLLNSLNDNA